MDYYDIIDLAAELVKFELTDDNVNELEEEFFAKYEISLESFSKLVEDLICNTSPANVSRIKKNYYEGINQN